MLWASRGHGSEPREFLSDGRARGFALFWPEVICHGSEPFAEMFP